MLFRGLIRLCITTIITLVLMICIKQSSDFKDKFYENVYNDNFNFAQVNSIYQSYFGSSFPFKNMLGTKPVFKETLTYTAKETYLDGVKLAVGNEYLIPVVTTGLVVFVGEKEGYGQVVVVEQVDGTDCWYGNLASVNVKLYDYVEVGSLLGSSDGYLYLVYRKDGKILNYEEQI